MLVFLTPSYAISVANRGEKRMKEEAEGGGRGDR
jgi:hypothetical protein